MQLSQSAKPLLDRKHLRIKNQRLARQRVIHVDEPVGGGQISAGDVAGNLSEVGIGLWGQDDPAHLRRERECQLWCDDQMEGLPRTWICDAMPLR